MGFIRSYVAKNGVIAPKKGTAQLKRAVL
jgi:hypothetical protein